MTQSYKNTTVTLNPVSVSIHCTNHFERKTVIAFIDGLGDISLYGSINKTKRLGFWSPPIGRERSGSDDYPDIVADFPVDCVSCTEFKNAAEASRDSFK